MLLAAAPVAAFVAACVALELLAPREAYPLRARFPTVTWFVIQPALVVLAVYPLMTWWRQLGVAPLVDLTGLPFWAAGLAALVLFDGLRYLSHRLQHAVWWPFHAVHHSIRELHAASSYAHPLEGLVDVVAVLVPFSLVRTAPEVLLLVGGISGFQNVVIHSPIRWHLGPLRAVLVDARYHRLHHSLEPRHHDRNFGFVFSFWDRLFGTACQPRRDDWPATGIDELPPPRTFAGYLLHPLQHLPWARAARRTSG
jgi:sterol desaturase/sphingolipid hydroxylase (fatty acid hydroxylase superfamily)